MQSGVQVLLILMAIAAFLGVVLEEVIHVNKAKVVLFFGALAWMVLFIATPDEAFRGQVQAALNHNILDSASLSG
jgi:uncharacterized membrane protein